MLLYVKHVILLELPVHLPTHGLLDRHLPECLLEQHDLLSWNGRAKVLHQRRRGGPSTTGLEERHDPRHHLLRRCKGRVVVRCGSVFGMWIERMDFGK